MPDPIPLEFNALVHELTGRLSTISMVCELLAADGMLHDLTVFEKRVQRIRQNAESARRVIEAVGRWNETSALDPEQVDISELAARVVRDYTSSEPAYARVQVKIQSLIGVKADPEQIEIVIANLIGNALKFSGCRETPSVCITASTDGNETRVHVSDNGVGLAQEDAVRIFKPFARCRPEFEGSGIGLALVRHIIQRHGGRVWATGELGVGCTVSFSIPR